MPVLIALWAALSPAAAIVDGGAVDKPTQPAAAPPQHAAVGEMLDGGAAVSTPGDGGKVAANELSIHLAVLEPDGGADLVDLDGGVPIDAQFQVRVSPRVQNCRLRLLDTSDRQLEVREQIDSKEDLQALISPSAPLNPGTAYHVAIEPDGSDPMLDARGSRYAGSAVHFRTAGSPPAPKPRGKRRHRH